MQYVMFNRIILNDISQESRIAFTKRFGHMSQDTVASQLRVIGDNR